MNEDCNSYYSAYHKHMLSVRQLLEAEYLITYSADIGLNIVLCAAFGELLLAPITSIDVMH